jgi:endonuclease YncB( thermonuclease family)
VIGLLFALAVSANTVEVVGADSVRANGHVFRLYDIDAPQVGAQCQRERERAEQTEAYVRDLVANARRIEIVPGYDPRGRQSWPRDHAGRRLADIRIDGVDLGVLLKQQGRAVHWNNYQTFNWCGTREAQSPRTR